MAEQTNAFEDFWGAIRKYIVPKAAGGGYTKKEEEEIKKNLEKAYKETEDKKPSDYANDVGEMFLGIDVKKSGGQMLIVGIIVFVFIALFKD